MRCVIVRVFGGLSHGGFLVVWGLNYSVPLPHELPHVTVVFPHFLHFSVPSQTTNLEKGWRNNKETGERQQRDNVAGKVAAIWHPKHGETSMWRTPGVCFKALCLEWVNNEAQLAPSVNGLKLCPRILCNLAGLRCRLVKLGTVPGRQRVWTLSPSIRIERSFESCAHGRGYVCVSEYFAYWNWIEIWFFQPSVKAIPVGGRLLPGLTKTWGASQRILKLSLANTVWVSNRQNCARRDSCRPWFCLLKSSFWSLREKLGARSISVRLM